MAVTFKQLEWIISSYKVNRIVDELGNYRDPLIEIELSFGEKVLDGNGQVKVDAAGAELWKSYFTKHYVVRVAELSTFMANQARSDFEYKVAMPAPGIGAMTMDSVNMAFLYPMANWLLDIKRWVL